MTRCIFLVITEPMGSKSAARQSVLETLAVTVPGSLVEPEDKAFTRPPRGARSRTPRYAIQIGH